VLSTLTAVLGMAPLIVMPGLGAEIYRGLAAVVAGGMVVGTTFTWLLMPSLLRLGEEGTVPALQIGAEALPGGST
jgi:multidrug efflux pump subunit AcrB